MNLKCVVGMHDWVGCKCSKCGKTRDQQHDWKDDCERCSQCGATRANAHQWSGCKCTVCGSVRDEEHDWRQNCEKCSTCGATRKDVHQWEGCKCRVCGMTREQDHAWDRCKCTRCGKQREPEHPDHDWKTDCEHCARCGLARPGRHQWEGCKCCACGTVRNQGHALKDSVCTRCGQTLSSQEILERDEEVLFNELRQAEGLDSKKHREVALNCFRKLFDVYTKMLRLDAKDSYALKQVYRLCCQWEPIFKDQREKRDSFMFYSDLGTRLKFSDPDWFRSLRVKAVIWPDYKYDKSDRETVADSTYSIIYSEGMKAASDALEYFQDSDKGIEMACLFGDNALWKLGMGGDSSSKQIYASEALQGFNTALQITLGDDINRIDALIPLWVLTKEMEYLERALSIDGDEVYRATFGRMGTKSA